MKSSLVDTAVSKRQLGKSSHNLEYSFKCGARSVHRGNAALFNDEGAKKKATTYYLQEDSIVGLWEKISKTLFYHLPFTIDKIIFYTFVVIFLNGFGRS